MKALFALASRVRLKSVYGMVFLWRLVALDAKKISNGPRVDSDPKWARKG